MVLAFQQTSRLATAGRKPTKEPMTTELVSYPVQFQNKDVSDTIAAIENAVIGLDRELVIVALVAYALCLQDPALATNSRKLQEALDNVSSHMCWVLQGADMGMSNIDPKMMN